MRARAQAIRIVLLLTVLGGHAPAQGAGPYAGATLGVTQLQAPGPRFARPSATVPAAVLGYATRRGPFVEGRVAWLRDETTEPRGDNEAPYTIGLRATLVEASVGYRPTGLRLGPVQPVASIGAVWARVVDSWQSDTPEEQQRSTVPGVSAAVGLEAALGRGVALRTRGSYRHMRNSTDRPVRYIGLRGTAWEVGLQWRP